MARLICHRCGARYAISDDKIRSRSFKFRCKKCSATVVIPWRDAQGQAPERSSAESAPAMPEPAGRGEAGGGLIDRKERDENSVLFSLASLQEQLDIPSTSDGDDTGGGLIDLKEHAENSVLFSLASLQEQPRQDPAPAPVADLRLAITHDGQTVSVQPLAEVAKIGTLQASHVRLTGPDVWGIHAVIESAGKTSATVIDMGSPSGTRVNGERVNKAPLGAEDVIEIGGYRLVPAFADTSWYAVVDGEQNGPLGLDALLAAWDRQEISAETFVWHDGMTDWRRAGQLEHVVAFLPPEKRPEPLPGIVRTPASTSTPRPRQAEVVRTRPSADTPHPHKEVAKSHDVFISYRRGGGAETARLLKLSLANRGLECFVDVDDLGAAHFDERLLEAIAAANNVIAILTPGSLDRCVHEGDWLRRELSHAIKLNKRLIPVIMPGFEFPAADQLPDDLTDLLRHNAVTYSHDYFNATLEKLVTFLDVECLPPRA
jgi:predicted Zn finger-like uncharacterized protein